MLRFISVYDARFADALIKALEERIFEKYFHIRFPAASYIPEWELTLTQSLKRNFKSLLFNKGLPLADRKHKKWLKSDTLSPPI